MGEAEEERVEMNGTMKMRHPKRGGWKGPKKSKRNHEANREWMENKKAGREKQVFLEVTNSWFHY
jgi:hypothetical protein